MEKFSFQDQPQLRMLSNDQISTMHEKALELLENTGVYFQGEEVLKIFDRSGAKVDFQTKIVKIPPQMVETAVKNAPSSFTLYSRDGKPSAVLGQGNVYFDPGSSGIRMLESDGETVREAASEDLVKIAKVCEALPHVDLLATALTPYDIPKNIGDSFRVYALLKHSTKPFITGAYSADGVKAIRALLAADAGGFEKLREKPRAVLDITSIPPLKWTEVSCRNLMDAATYGMPIETISVPLLGAASPATLAGSVLLHTVETLSGIVLTQLINPGNPMIYGSAPMFFDMKNMTTSLNSIETSMIAGACSQMGKYYGMPVHTYACLSDAKRCDSQAGLESAVSGILAALAGIDIISGPGMLDFCNTFSLEKLVIDNEICGMAHRITRGMDFSEETLAADLIAEMGSHGDYLSTRHTLKWFKKEPYLPSAVIDRQNCEKWKERGAKTSFDHAREIVSEMLENPKAPPLSREISDALDRVWFQIAADDGELDEAAVKATFV
ncbi:trimethylamine methyltransferase family protein [Anoxybacterium hadale]|uniref:trimethylamine methyltransferase family protein n=1 Tax=Anoxybacterium hadale TaxID=3408580 RepID=UPI003B00BA8D